MAEHEPRARYCIVITGLPVGELRDDIACSACDELRMLMELDPDVEVMSPNPSPRNAPNLGPDCAVGKHDACRGEAWDDAADSETSCECPCHIPRQSGSDD